MVYVVVVKIIQFSESNLAILIKAFKLLYAIIQLIYLGKILSKQLEVCMKPCKKDVNMYLKDKILKTNKKGITTQIGLCYLP